MKLHDYTLQKTFLFLLSSYMLYLVVKNSEMLNVKKNQIKIAQNMVILGE
ncbi:hypothetical protein B6N60_04453 [Richelia sinica FACHB-800]|uniref:Uncharacterized protein n=1 Tax=Richelia sinica FACHB-800 TaxID=1357546 RepID=A0A975TCX8_9NOST|nr:hypothetical protein B6N60_04453 [Richelia sinica FACHB-800]